MEVEGCRSTKRKEEAVITGRITERGFALFRLVRFVCSWLGLGDNPVFPSDPGESIDALVQVISRMRS